MLEGCSGVEGVYVASVFGKALRLSDEGVEVWTPVVFLGPASGGRGCNGVFFILDFLVTVVATGFFTTSEEVLDKREESVSGA